MPKYRLWHSFYYLYIDDTVPLVLYLPSIFVCAFEVWFNTFFHDLTNMFWIQQSHCNSIIICFTLCRLPKLLDVSHSFFRDKSILWNSCVSSCLVIAWDPVDHMLFSSTDVECVGLWCNRFDILCSLKMSWKSVLSSLLISELLQSHADDTLNDTSWWSSIWIADESNYSAMHTLSILVPYQVRDKFYLDTSRKNKIQMIDSYSKTTLLFRLSKLMRIK